MKNVFRAAGNRTRLQGRLAAGIAEGGRRLRRSAGRAGSAKPRGADRRVGASPPRRAARTTTANRRAARAFLAIGDHTLRTALTIILGYSELLQEDAAALGASTLLPHLTEIQRAASQVRLLLDALPTHAARAAVAPRSPTRGGAGPGAAEHEQ